MINFSHTFQTMLPIDNKRERLNGVRKHYINDTINGITHVIRWFNFGHIPFRGRALQAFVESNSYTCRNNIPRGCSKKFTNLLPPRLDQSSLNIASIKSNIVCLCPLNHIFGSRNKYDKIYFRGIMLVNPKSFVIMH